MSMTSREQFEQAIKARFGDSIDYRVCKNSDGEYMAWDMQVAWWSWQAASKASEKQLTESRHEFTAANATIHNLELNVAQVVAENSSVKAMNDCLSEELRGYESDGAFEGPKMHLLWWQCETPATDAYLAEVRAQGVDAAIEQLHKKFEGTGHIGVPVMVLESFAAQLRKGAKS